MPDHDSDEGPFIACPNCGEPIPVSAGVGPVGAKQWTCPKCGHKFELKLDDE